MVETKYYMITFTFTTRNIKESNNHKNSRMNMGMEPILVLNIWHICISINN